MFYGPSSIVSLYQFFKVPENILMKLEPAPKGLVPSWAESGIGQLRQAASKIEIQASYTYFVTNERPKDAVEKFRLDRLDTLVNDTP